MTKASDPFYTISEAKLKQPLLKKNSSIIREQLCSFACICTDGFKLKFQVPDLSPGLSELDVQLAVLVTESGDFL